MSFRGRAAAAAALAAAALVSGPVTSTPVAGPDRTPGPSLTTGHARQRAPSLQDAAFGPATPAPRTPPVTPRSALPQPALPRVLPRVGLDIAAEMRTCGLAITRATPTAADQCLAWRVSGPVNVVIVVPGRTTSPDLLPPPGWRPAMGRWLVASGRTLRSPLGCGQAAHATGLQIERRLSPTAREHFKVSTAVCEGSGRPFVILFGDAHTDRYIAGCGGDQAVDWNAARDDLVVALVSSGRVTSVAYSTRRPVPYPGSCGHRLLDDGRAAVVVLAGPSPPAGNAAPRRGPAARTRSATA